VSHECIHISEREEAFYKISLTVKNKKTVQQALELYVEGDLFDGDNKYMCAECKRKVTASKRLSFSGLPQCLILHLKRFEFDFDTLRKVCGSCGFLTFFLQVKVNDYFEFSEQLSMLPYCRAEGSDVQSVDYYEYVLHGILIHTGVADGGHYYSFARHSAFPEGWAEFNDVSVRAFHPDMIAKACFGGKPQGKDLETGRNAYMLFYMRKDCLKAGITRMTQESSQEKQVEGHAEEKTTEKPESREKSGSSEEKTHSSKESAETTSEKLATHLQALPLHLRQSVWNKNLMFLSDKQLFSFDFVMFVWQLCQPQPNLPRALEKRDRFNVAKIVSLFTFNVLGIHYSGTHVNH